MLLSLLKSLNKRNILKMKSVCNNINIKRICIISLLSKMLIALSLFAYQISAFEESIFEDEDIYRQSLPATPPSTGITVPGTKWCGPGNTSLSYNDLGKERETDICCRDHDNCDEILMSHSSLHGLNNTEWLPILKCSCEQKFINCLQAVNNMMSNSLGHIYYSTRQSCIANGHPILGCSHYQKGRIRQRCVRYQVDTTKPKVWQFYDMPFFTTKAN